jgi:methionyl-tRNA synthetase
MLVVTSAFPFVPATLTAANFASTYFPADTQVRLRRLLGDEAAHITAVDVHSQLVSSDGRTRAGADRLCATKGAEYARAFSATSTTPDVLATTDAPWHLAAVRAALRTLDSQDLLVEQTILIQRCADCASSAPPRLSTVTTGPRIGDLSTAAALAEDRVCPFCKSPRLIPTPSRHLFLRLEPCRPRLHILASQILPAFALPPVLQWLAAPLADWDISRDHSIGISLAPRLPDQSLYLWFESLVGYGSLAAHHNLSASSYCQFFGLNILYYHAIVWPVIYERALKGDATRLSLVPRGLIDRAHSDAALLDLDAVGARWPADYLRFYTTFKCTDDGVETRLTLRDFATVINDVLCSQVGNLLRRVASFLWRYRSVVASSPYEDAVPVFFEQQVVPRLRSASENAQPRQALLVVLEYARYLNRSISTRHLYVDPTPERVGLGVFMLASLLVILKPYLPTITDAFNVFCDWEPRTLADIHHALQMPLRERIGKWSPLNVSC